MLNNNQNNISDVTCEKYPLRSIYFYLTSGCNLRCRHCWIKPEKSKSTSEPDFLKIDTIRHVLEQGKELGVHSVKLTGGEPMFSPHFVGTLNLIRENKMKLMLETNATLLTPKIAECISRCENPFVAVSLDGARADTHDWMRGVKGCYNAAISGIKLLTSNQIRPQIIMTITKKNVGEMTALVRLAEFLGAGSVKFNIMQPIGKGEQLYSDEKGLSVEELMAVGSEVSQTLQKLTSLKIQFDQPIAFDPLGKIFDENQGGCNLCGILGIISVIPDGSYAMCGIGRSIPELVFGNADNDLLKDVWKDSRRLREIRHGLPGKLEGICAGCIMKHMCLGRCVAHNYYRTKRLFGPFWYCEEANKLGRFPESRKSFKNISTNRR